MFVTTNDDRIGIRLQGWEFRIASPNPLGATLQRQNYVYDSLPVEIRADVEDPRNPCGDGVG